MTRATGKKKSLSHEPVAANGPTYTIAIANASAHLFAVRLDVDLPAAVSQRFALPVWIPGSYMVREFARHIIEIRAFAGGEKRARPVHLTKLDKTTWRADSCSGRLTLEYVIYAFDLSVRAAHLDTSHGFFNGSSVFLAADGFEGVPHRVNVVRPVDKAKADWRVATTLPAVQLDEHGFGSYLAPDYDALIDHPVEMGRFLSLRFNACGTPHDVVITGRVPNLDSKRLTADLKLICEAQIKLFDPERARAPFHRYAFLTTVVGEGYGGLEHRASTALLCSRDDLPRLHQNAREESYRGFLGLASHEYFHSWNVKRIKPNAFVPYQLDRENYTRLLWIFEGFTSYYDDLILVRCGLLSESQYLATLGKTMAEVARGMGHKRQSVAESSFDAWTKYYRQDENSPNAIVSYYKKGALVALALDLHLRAKTRGKRSLDDVMRLLWTRFGALFEEGQGVGVGEDEFAEVVQEATGVDVHNEVAAWAYDRSELPMVDLLRPFNITLEAEHGSHAPSLGLKLAADPLGCRIVTVYEGEAGQRGGLSAGDVLIAIDGLRVNQTTLGRSLKRYAPGQSVVAHVFRRDELIALDVELDVEPAFSVRLVCPRASRFRSAWLEGSA